MMTDDERRFRQHAQAMAQQQQQQHWGALASAQQGGDANAYGGTEGLDSSGGFPWGASNVGVARPPTW